MEKAEFRKDLIRAARAVTEALHDEGEKEPLASSSVFMALQKVSAVAGMHVLSQAGAISPEMREKQLRKMRGVVEMTMAEVAKGSPLSDVEVAHFAALYEEDAKPLEFVH